MKRVLIIANLFGNNRQGYDLAEVLRNHGCSVRLVQFASNSEPDVGNYGVCYKRPHGLFSKFHVLQNILAIASKSLFRRYDRIVCIGSVLLPLAGLLKFVNKATLIYYSLEYCTYGFVGRYVLRSVVGRYIDVEEHRKERVFEDLNINKPSLVVYNMPPLTDDEYGTGGLRLYLKEKFGLIGNEKIVVYAGSYQSYSCLEKIISASGMFPSGVVLVLMIPRGVPDGIEIKSSNVFIVPAQGGGMFYNWLAESDGALLPYESADDFNVQNCSPQKLFDCYRVGVPYLASRRPLIETIHASLPGAGEFCNFMDIESIVHGVKKLIMQKSEQLSKAMIALYRDKYNYSAHGNKLYNFICEDSI